MKLMELNIIQDIAGCRALAACMYIVFDILVLYCVLGHCSN